MLNFCSQLNQPFSSPVNLYRLVLGLGKMDTYVEPEIEEVQGPMDDDDILMDTGGYENEDVLAEGNFYLVRLASALDIV